ncbi:MAG: hypothetical protein WCI18_02135 [Pseudomonadota bacterium]
MKFKMGTCSLSTVALLVAACGGANEKARKTETISASEALTSSEVQGNVLTDTAEEITDQLANLNGSAASFGLSGSKSIDSKTNSTRTCVEGADKTVTISLDKSFDGSAGGSRVSKSMSFKDSQTRIWSHPTIALKCAENHLDFSLVAGKELGLKKDVKYSRTKSSTATGPKKTRSKSVVKEGTRTVEYLANIGSPDANGYSLHSLKINSSSSKTIKTDVKGVESALTITSKTTDLLVDEQKNDSDFSSKLIKSGTLESSLDNGVEFKLEYSQVKFVNSEEEDSCRPVSGSIVGTIKNADTTKTFTVTFAEAADPEIKVEGVVSSEIEMDFSGCDFGKAN